MSDAQDNEEIEAALLAANAAFYAAFEALDFDAMRRVWAHDESVVCVHPGWPPLMGWLEVRESWRSIIAGTDYMRIRPSQESVFLEGGAGLGEGIARVLCVENIYTVQQGMSVHSQIACTNLFRQEADGSWSLVHHHGSPMGSGSAAESAEG